MITPRTMVFLPFPRINSTANATNNDDDGGDNEEYDSFPSTTVLVDPASLAILDDAETSNRRTRNNNNTDHRNRSSNASRTSRSQATTQLATEVGSVVGPKKNPFMKSVTFFDPKVYYKKLAAEKNAEADNSDGLDSNGDVENGAEEEEDEAQNDEDGIDCADHDDDHDVDDADSLANDGAGDDESDALTFEVNDLTHWDLTLIDPVDNTHLQKSSSANLVRKLSNKLLNRNSANKPALFIDDFEGLIEYSCFAHGDSLVSINNKKIKPAEFTAEKATDYMHRCLQEEGVLHIIAENTSGNDTVINVTIVRPRPNMTYHDLGLIVWNWPFLCVREIREGSIFQHTCIKEGDQISAINDIDCTKLRAREFAKCVDELPGMEITITLVRRKHRANMSFS
ncbi:hypothetical protein ACHAXS_007327 [Conticribra weissflogii]